MSPVLALFDYAPPRFGFVDSVVIDDDDADMAKLWTSPKFSKARVDWAGDMLAGRIERSDQSALDTVINMDTAIDIINNWRSSHSYPLQALKVTLRGRAAKRSKYVGRVEFLHEANRSGR